MEPSAVAWPVLETGLSSRGTRHCDPREQAGVTHPTSDHWSSAPQHAASRNWATRAEAKTARSHLPLWWGWLLCLGLFQEGIGVLDSPCDGSWSTWWWEEPRKLTLLTTTPYAVNCLRWVWIRLWRLRWLSNFLKDRNNLSLKISSSHPPPTWTSPYNLNYMQKSTVQNCKVPCKCKVFYCCYYDLMVPQRPHPGVQRTKHSFFFNF